jgi:hypothetical protein
MRELVHNLQNLSPTLFFLLSRLINGILGGSEKPLKNLILFFQLMKTNCGAVVAWCGRTGAAGGGAWKGSLAVLLTSTDCHSFRTPAFFNNSTTPLALQLPANLPSTTIAGTD